MEIVRPGVNFAELLFRYLSTEERKASSRHAQVFFGAENHAASLPRDTCTYIVNNKKRGSLFLTITLANLNRFYSFYIILMAKKFYMRL